ncbi:hypothetical protein [Caballeronia pedi]|uniref:hypothetical protein n=1 Tax=Caballeronia pedi TaxID=1777141 RepID=UPI00135C5DCB|nr:hypothetical protein [Caballeronia pedi]
MKTQTLIAVVRIARRETAVDFQLSTGRLLITEGPQVIEQWHPSDAWLAMASLNRGDG